MDEVFQNGWKIDPKTAQHILLADHKFDDKDIPIGLLKILRSKESEAFLRICYFSVVDKAFIDDHIK